MTDEQTAAAGPGWTLSGRDGGGRPVTIVVDEAILRRADLGLAVGRHPDLAELVVDDPSVSRRHARLSIGADGLVIEDLNSLNGTEVDGKPLQPFEAAVLQPGQFLALGAIGLRVERRGGNLPAGG